MLDFVFILLILLEIILTIIVVKKTIELEKRVKKAHLAMLETSKILFIANIRFKKSISKINKVVSFITNKKIYTAKKIISTIISMVEIIILLRSLDFSKGFKINYRNIKKLLLTQTIRTFAKNIIKFVLN